MSTGLLILLSVLEAVLLVVVLALALILVRQSLTTIADGLGTLRSALADVQSQHLRPLAPDVEAINDRLAPIAGTLPGIAAKAAIVADHARPRHGTGSQPPRETDEFGRAQPPEEGSLG
jgi:hypothetical protein